MLPPQGWKLLLPLSVLPTRSKTSAGSQEGATLWGDGAATCWQVETSMCFPSLRSGSESLQVLLLQGVGNESPQKPKTTPCSYLELLRLEASRPWKALLYWQGLLTMIAWRKQLHISFHLGQGSASARLGLTRIRIRIHPRLTECLMDDPAYHPCYGLNVCVPPKFIGWNHIPSVMVFRSGTFGRP